MVRTPEGDLEQELRDPEYAKLYGASDIKAEIAITLAEARHAAKKTQKEVADAMSLSQPYVARLEGGEANPTIGTIGSLLAVMGFKLVTGTAPLKPEPIPSSSRFLLINAAYGSDAALSLRASNYQVEGQDMFGSCHAYASAAGSMAGAVLFEAAQNPAGEAITGVPTQANASIYSNLGTTVDDLHYGVEIDKEPVSKS